MASLQLHIHNLMMDPRFCRLGGFVSSVVGLLCYALSSSFKHLIGEWNLLKIFLYILLSFIISSIMLFTKKWNLSKSFLLKAHVGFLVLMLTSVYSYFYDKAVNGKPDILSLMSSGAFALMSLCMSRQINLGFERELLHFFLGSLFTQLTEINWMLAFVVAAFSYALIFLLSSLKSQPETGTITASDQIVLDIDNTNREEREADATSGFSSDYGNHPQQLQLLHRRNVEIENDGISAPGSSKTVENLTDQAQLLVKLKRTTEHLQEAKEEIMSLTDQVENLTDQAQLLEVELKRTTKQPQEVMAIAGEETAKYKAADQRNESLTDQVENLTDQAQLLEVELKRTTKQPQEVMAIAGEETAKYKAADQRIKSLTDQLKILSCKAEVQEVELERTTKQLNDLRGSLIQLLSNGSSTIRNRRAGHKKQSQSDATNRNGSRTEGISESRSETSWVVEEAPGVYITLTSPPGGVNDRIKVLFSRRLFTEEQAQQWWADNRERVYELYNVRKIDKLTVGVGNGSEDDKGQELMSTIGSEEGEYLVVGESPQLQYTGYEASMSSWTSFGSSISEEGLRARRVKQPEKRELGMQNSRGA